MTNAEPEAGALAAEPPRSGLSRFLDLSSIDGQAMLAIGAMASAVAIDALVLAFDSAGGAAMRPFHQVTLIALLVILAGVVPCYRLLRAQGDRQAVLTIQIAELRRAKEAAETANLLKARYLANVSHEIRSPLNAIYGYAQLVEQDADVPPRDAARIIRRCAEHMTALVESLLDHSRLENGLLRIRSEIVCLPEFVDQIASMMRPAAEAKGLSFVYDMPAFMPEFVRTDQSRLRQALINLLTNAIKFTQQGSVTLRLRYRGEIAVFEIEDTGPGIAEEDRERIFDPYEQVTGANDPAKPGVGLGLPITKAIIEIMGGKLEVESTPGSGSCFRATLMLGQANAALAPPNVSRRIVGFDGQARSVLVVDDDPFQRGFLERFLSGCGLEVVAVANGETAVSLCAVRQFDLAVLDISLPGISGWETATRLRELATGDMAIVMASANAQEFQHPDYHRPAHDHFLVKPYRLDDMAEALSALLKLSWRWEATDAAEPGAANGDRLPASARPHVERLRERIHIGHVRGIEAEVALLAKHAPGEGELINALYAALDQLDLAGMVKLLEGK
jgi:signal transduction histidine kinase/CheY-like chemotaxis protein